MASDPIGQEIRKQAFADAMQDTGRHVTARWSQLPKEVRLGQALAMLRFQSMSDSEKLAMFVALHQRATVLAIDRANQIADAHAFGFDVKEPPAA